MSYSGGGDFNYVEHDLDRYDVSKDAFIGHHDYAEAKFARDQVWHPLGLVAVGLGCHTQTQGNTSACLDRIYMNHYAAEQLVYDYFAFMLRTPRHLSDHSPVVVGRKRRIRAGAARIPRWVTQHVSWPACVRHHFGECCPHPLEVDPWIALRCLKDSFIRASRDILRAGAVRPLLDPSDRMHIYIAFLRAMQMGNFGEVRRLSDAYDELGVYLARDEQGGSSGGMWMPSPIAWYVSGWLSRIPLSGSWTGKRIAFPRTDMPISVTASTLGFSASAPGV